MVTGAGHGVGEAVAIELARSGANIAVNDILITSEGGPAETAAEAVREAGGNAITHFGDASSMSDAEDLIASAYDAFGRVDGVRIGTATSWFLEELNAQDNS